VEMKQLKCELLVMVNNESLNRAAHSKKASQISKVDLLQKQLRTSDEVLQSLEKKNFDNMQLQKYLNEFDNLITPSLKPSIEEGIISYNKEQYETFNRVRPLSTS
jgi:hypothetical protein